MTIKHWLRGERTDYFEVPDGFGRVSHQIERLLDTIEAGPDKGILMYGATFVDRWKDSLKQQAAAIREELKRGLK